MLNRNDLAAALAIVRRHITATGDVAAYRVAAALDDALTAANGSPATPFRNDGFVTISEAAHRLGCRERWARELAPRIGGVKVAGRWWIPAQALPEPEEEP